MELENNNNNNNNNAAAADSPMQQLQASSSPAPSLVLAMDSPVCMILTATETARALEIKQAVEAEESLRNLSDFEYAQYALATSDDSMAVVLGRISRMQSFRDEYRIQDTPEEGTELYRALNEQHPGFFLALEYLVSDGNFASIVDMKAFYPGTIQTPQQRRNFMGGLYYKLQSMSVHFQSIREGYTSVVECDGAGFQNVNPVFYEQMMVEIFQCYPKLHKEILLLNSPTAINMQVALWKKFFNKNMHETFHLGCQVPGFEGERIDRLYKSPTEEMARQRMVDKVAHYLRVRYLNQGAFTLPSS